MGDKCVHCRAFPIDQLLPDDKKEDGNLIMKTRLSEATLQEKYRRDWRTLLHSCMLYPKLNT